ncbi:50S ribosomal protein L11 methyltransferase [Sorangium sp. So ce448]|uniref:50S ribosomal protein L11 methyltransferase n=1 Tax=Sorangium sp. So ce448 TaxID=3133314 RepID=UPI003F5FA4B3
MIHEDITLVVSRSVLIQLDGDGQFIASNSVSRAPCPVGDAELAVLRAFARPAPLARARGAVCRETGMAPEQFFRTCERLARDNILTPVRADFRADDAAYVPASAGFASFALQHWMLRDATRVTAYRSAIQTHVRDKVVVDVGCGTGILGLFAAQMGARKVYAIEESAIATLAREMIRANGAEDRVSLLTGNSKDIELPEPADVIIHEILGIDPFFENVIPYIDDARRRFLRGGEGRLIPHRIDLCCVGVESEFVPSIRERAVLEAREFGPMYGLDFSPYLHVLEHAQEISQDTDFPRRGSDFRESFFPLGILSEECLLRTIDLNGDLVAQSTGETRATMRIRTDGRIGSLLLFFRAHLDERLQLTTSPYAPRTHWGWAIRDLPKAFNVKAGDDLDLRAAISTFAGRQLMQVHLR